MAAIPGRIESCRNPVVFEKTSTTGAAVCPKAGANAARLIVMIIERNGDI
jgi:hypothetical protein